MKVLVLNNQSIFDMAIRYCGTPLAAFELARLNGISVSANLTPGHEITVPEPSVRITGGSEFRILYNRDVVSYFDGKNHQPATKWERDPMKLSALLEGIDYWEVFNEFEVQ